MVQKHINRFGFIARAHLDLAEKLTEGRERFDRVILDKKIESRERYMKMLPRLCKQVEQLSASITQQYAQVARNSAKKDAQETRRHSRGRSTSLQRLYPKFYFKQKVTEEFVHLADEAVPYLALSASRDGQTSARAKRRLQLRNKMRELEKSAVVFAGRICRAIPGAEELDAPGAARPRPRWWKPICVSSFRSPRNTPTAACRSST